MGVRCSQCGRELSADAKFCLSCGARVLPAKAICPCCGRDIPRGRLCLHCGYRLTKPLLRRGAAGKGEILPGVRAENGREGYCRRGDGYISST